MTLDEAIKHCEEVAKEQDKLCKRYDDASGYTRSGNEKIRTNEAKKCAVCAEEHRMLAWWLRDYKRLKEQEPSGDAISRQAVHEAITKWAGSMSVLIALPTSEVKPLLDSIHELPSANPQEPKTVLYSGDGYADGYMVYDMAECPNCGYEYEDGDKDWGLSYCPNCGQALDWERSE